MTLLRITTASLLCLTLVACDQGRSTEPRVSMRNSMPMTQQEAVLIDQAEALDKMTRDVIRSSTVNGALIGAVAGCGLTVVSAGNAKNCVGGLVAGGVVGAAVGNAQGKKDVARRKELVSPNTLVRTIGKANDQMALVKTDLSATLAMQDAEMSRLAAELKAGQITGEAYAQRMDEIRSHRAALTESLGLSAAQARTAHNNLQEAVSKGQTGLDWHLHATKQLEREATSARSRISLL